ncbi:MAG: hypothetical protein EXQ59_01590 [Acidobacteria bacterium]|nr:hypothetical protein [Acidobacteriota bacterium]
MKSDRPKSNGWTLAAVGAMLAAVIGATVAAPSAAGQRAVPRGSTGGSQDSSPAPAPAPAAPQGARAPSTPRASGGSGSAPSGSASGGSGGLATPTSQGGSGGDAASYGRPRDGRVTGTAVARPSSPPRQEGSGGGPTIYTYPFGYYPWGYSGFGFGGYYGFYDPWGYGYPYGYARNYSIRYADDGALRLKVKPEHAAVFVDGYFAGHVGEFDGLFQRLHVEPGPHRIEVLADGYEPLVFDVRILPDRTVTYSGDLRLIQK